MTQWLNKSKLFSEQLWMNSYKALTLWSHSGLIQGGPKVGTQYIVYSILYTYFWPILYKMKTLFTNEIFKQKYCL